LLAASQKAKDLIESLQNTHESRKIKGSIQDAKRRSNSIMRKTQTIQSKKLGSGKIDVKNQNFDHLETESVHEDESFVRDLN
jgi:hypothetical protein